MKLFALLTVMKTCLNLVYPLSYESKITFKQYIFELVDKC